MATLDDRTESKRRLRARGDNGTGRPQVAHREGREPVSPLVRQLDAIAEEIAHGQVFEDSTPSIRAAREGRWPGA